MDDDAHQLPRPLSGNYEIELPKYRHPGEPERYRLSAARLSAPKPEPPATRINFWFGTHRISALAASDLARDCPHLLRLHIRPSITARLIARFVGFLPACAQAWVRIAFVEWFLPDRAVLRIQKQGDDESELFDTEAKVYHLLRPLQGVAVPRCYGEVRYNGSRALLLEHLGGASLASPEGATLSLRELADLLQPCYRALHAFGVHHDDPSWGNFRLVDGGRIMVLDFERVALDLPPDDRTSFMRTNIWDLADRYRDARAYYRHEGLLEAA